MSIIFVNLAVAKNSHNLSLWQKILYISKSGEKEIKSSSYYFTASNTVKAEIKNFKSELAKIGHEVKCNYPLRYRLLQKKLNVNNISDFKECSELNQFISEIDHNKISLFYVSELLSSSASAFGHLMLVLHNEEVPELESEVIHYAAQANRDKGFLDYALKGLSGQYQGYYLRTKFFEKTYEYLKVEQRYLFGNELDLSRAQKLNLYFLLYELRKAKFDYYFLNENCGYRLHDLLAIILDEERLDTSIYSLPIDTFKAFYKYSKRKYVIAPYITKAKNIYNSLNETESKQAHKILSGEKKLNANSSNKLKQLIFYYGQYRYQKEKVIIPNYQENFNYAQTSLFDRQNKKSPASYQNANALSFALGTRNHLSERHYTQFAYRPVLRSLAMNQYDGITESAMELLAFEINLFDSKTELNKFKLFEITSLPQAARYFDQSSWSFALGLDRENKNLDLLSYSRFAYGRTYKFFGQVSLLISLGIEVNNSYEQYYYAPELIYISYLSPKNKFTFSSMAKQFEDHSLGILKGAYSYLFDENNEIIIQGSEFSDKIKQVQIKFNNYF